MRDDGAIETAGIVLDVLPPRGLRIRLRTGRQVLADLEMPIGERRPRILAGDRVRVVIHGPDHATGHVAVYGEGETPGVRRRVAARFQAIGRRRRQK